MSGLLLDKIKKQAAECQNDLVRIRREIHQHPELGFEEHKTSALVADVLASLGLKVQRGVGGTGVVGLLDGQEGRVIALRADMDALPIQEQSEKPYKSRIPGRMHACGHDANTAMVLGAAMVLAPLRERLSGSVKFIFQPCEEQGPGGAQAMIQASALEDPPVEAIIGIHTFPLLPAGVIGTRPGAVMAAVDNFRITILGEGGHGASPHLSRDAIVAAASAILSLQTVVSRRVNPLDPAVVSIGTIEGGSRPNIIADEVRMTGTVRTLDEGLRKEMPRLIKEVLQGVAQAHGVRYRLEYEEGYPVVRNDPAMARLCLEAAAEVLGSERAVTLEQPTMGGEDFAYYLERIPGCFLRMGIRDEEKGIIYPLHHPKFDIDEEVLSLGAATLAYTAVKILNRARG
ncbi:MAG: amidohydrolase [candidate division NC10 bacterium]|nr:amidohydrolase [candidate division NC10 bacterium]